MYDLNVMIIAQETGMELLSIITKIGDIEPFYCSAVGKAILAFLPEDEQNTIIDSLKMEKKTQNTITEKEQLLEELARISTKGYAVDNEEFHPGVRCLGVPIFDHRGRVVASLGISGPVNRIRLDKVEEYTSSMKDIALQISKKLGFEGKNNK